LDTSTQVTIRSAIIIGCMILVPLWALVGNSWTNVFRGTAVASSTHSGNQSKAPLYEPRRGGKPAELPAKRDELRLSDPAGMSEPLLDAQPLAAASPFQMMTAPTMPTAMPMELAATPATLDPSYATRINTAMPTPMPGEHAIQTVSTNSAVSPSLEPLPPVMQTMPVPHPAHVPLSMPTQTPPPAVETRPNPIPAAATPGDWFQWTEARLKQLGASQFILESSGAQGGYRFRCKAALANDPGFARHFEAQGDSALAAMQEVLRLVEAWRVTIK